MKCFYIRIWITYIIALLILFVNSRPQFVANKKAGCRLLLCIRIEELKSTLLSALQNRNYNASCI